VRRLVAAFAYARKSADKSAHSKLKFEPERLKFEPERLNLQLSSGKAQTLPFPHGKFVQIEAILCRNGRTGKCDRLDVGRRRQNMRCSWAKLQLHEVIRNGSVS